MRLRHHGGAGAPGARHPTVGDRQGGIPVLCGMSAVTADPEGAAHQPPHHGLIARLGIGQILSWGSLIYAFPLLADPMAAELGWSRTGVYLLASLSLGVAGLAAFPVGAAIDRGHGRAVLAGGSVLSALLLWAWGMARADWHLVAIFAGLGVAQAMTLYEAAFAVVARRFGGRARQGITTLTLWGGFAGTVGIPLTQMLLDQSGWRGAVEVLALIHLLVCLPLHLSLSAAAPPTDARAAPDGDPPASSSVPAGNGTDVRWALGQPVFWALAATLTLYYATVTGLGFHFYPLLTEHGFEPAMIVLALSLIGPAQVAGRLGLALLGSRVSFRAIGLATTLVLPATIGLLWLSRGSLPTLLVFAALYGAANGIMTIVRGAAVPELLTGRAYGRINGLLAMPAAVVRALAPTLVAVLWQVGASYDSVLLAALLTSLLVTLFFAIAALGAGRRPGPEPGR